LSQASGFDVQPLRQQNPHIAYLAMSVSAVGKVRIVPVVVLNVVNVAAAGVVPPMTELSMVRVGDVQP
jgi:hypothetical protein